MTALLAETEITEVPVWLYRLHSETSLLYVGKSANLATRFKRHARDASWWPEVTRRTITLYASEHEAALAEATAIRDEHPVHNVVHAGDDERWGLDAETLRQCRLIYRLRTSRGFSRAELAAATLLSEQLIGHIETGKRAPTHVTRRRIADAVGVPLAAITLPNYEEIRDPERGPLFPLDVAS